MRPTFSKTLLALLPALVAIACSDSNGDASPAPTDSGTTETGTVTLDGGSTDAAPDGTEGGCSAATLETLAAAIGPKLDAAAKDPSITDTPDFTLLLETEDGRAYSHSQGNSSAATVYESASTSKLVSAVVILDLVDQGLLTLDTKAHDLLPFWTETTVTLRHLLSFTSGFNDEPMCINLGASDFETCVTSMYTKNSASAPAAGTQFHYSGTHLQIAGLMAMKAKGASSWTAVFDAWKTKSGLFATATYDLPSATNPRLAGGMHWSATEYLGFLRALVKGQILKAATRTELFADQRGTATVSTSPAWTGMKEDWSYGFGNWLECRTAKQLGSFNCGAGHRNSSAGAYGAYPFIDFDNHYFGILARQGKLRTGFEGVNLLRAADEPITKWLACGK